MKVSICIPTYNRSALLRQLLDSIAAACSQPALAAAVQVCISDNASADDTAEMVSTWRALHHIDVVYHRETANRGADWNFIHAAQLAQGEFIWLMGSDDLIAPGAVECLLDKLTSGADMYLTGRSNYDFTMSTREFDEKFVSAPGTYDLSDKTQALRYLKACTGLGGLFSYLSANVVRTTAWKSQLKGVEGFLDSAYSHVYVLSRVAFAGAKVEALGLPLVKNRGGNDSFDANGAAHRVLIDLDGYMRILQALPSVVGDARLKHAFIGVLRRERPPVHTAFYLRRYASGTEWARARTLLSKLGTPGILLRCLDAAPALANMAHTPALRAAARRIFGRRGG